MNYKRVLLKMRQEEENRRYYLRVLINMPCSIHTKDYYKKEIDLCNSKIEALTLVLN